MALFQKATGRIYPFSPITKIMLIIGLDVRSNEKSSNKTSGWFLFYEKFLSVLWIVFIVYVAATFITGDITSGEKSIYEVVSRKFHELVAFLIWYILKTRKREVYLLLHEIYYFTTLLNAEVHRFWEYFGVVISLIVPFLSWLSLTLAMNEIRCKSFMFYISLNIDYIPDGYHCSVLYIVMIGNKLAIHSLRTAVTVLYVIICCTIRNILNKWSEIGAKKLTEFGTECRGNRSYMEMFEQITNILIRFESVMSLPIFLVTISDCIGMFYSFLSLRDMPNFFWPNVHNFFLTFILLRSLVSFLSVSIAASNVYESSKKVKEVQRKMLKSSLSSEHNSVRQLLLMSQVEIKPRKMNSVTAILLLTLAIGYLCSVFPLNETNCLNHINTLTLQTFHLSEGKNCLVVYPLVFFYDLALYVLPTALAALYVFLCYCLRKVLNRQTTLLTRKITSKSNWLDIQYIENVLKTYDKTIFVLKCFEKSFSIPIFLLQVSDWVGLFSCFLRLDPLNQAPELKTLMNSYKLGIIFFAIRALLSFSCVSLAASSINVADRTAKEAHEEMWKRVLASTKNEDVNTLVLSVVARHGPPFMLTAWGFYPFTKGLVLAALGSIMTYSLLALQINF
ncbi:uncharacterized protein TNCT_674521 [Trichonephila clavata]|uniref:Gustatory receptor n=1 Tax=Trichonephila clavata TaxID=2740835 RepID=A0A8X6KHA9_TRICU|nr:uncharacterized protein TNCT_674521 [Trichonephila clavata]